VKRLQSKLAEKGLDGIILKDRWNIIYVSGLFHTSTERPFWLFVPTKGEPTFFHPSLDRDLVQTWWIKDREWSFDFKHAGDFNKVVYQAGPTVELVQWMLKGLAQRGFGKSKLGIEEEVGPSTMKKMQKALPEAKFSAAGDILLKMRMVKTPEEIELTQKAIDLHDKMLEFGHDYILKHGTDATDFEVRHKIEEYGTQELMKVMNPDGRPHNAIGISLQLSCRTGVGTAYPHPNQFFYSRIKKGDAIQIAGRVTIGGYGGEGYRAMQIEPMTDLHKKMWEVHTEMTLTQQELSKAGARCNETAKKVLELAIKAGLEKYVYHRPAHGQGMEGHQAPYLSPGDDTVLEENMMFSNEPGLYNPEGGFGYNHSNCVLVGKEKGTQMNKTPLTKEWCWLRL
jgi:Xaa-Pro aminopeptidase